MSNLTLILESWKTELRQRREEKHRRLTEQQLFHISDEPTGVRGQFLSVDRFGIPVLHPHKKQKRAITSRAKRLLVLAGWQSGKSVVGPPWMAREMKEKGPGNYLLAAPTFKLLDKQPVRMLGKFLGGILGLGEVVGGAAGEFRVSEAGHKKLWGTGPYSDMSYDPLDPSRIVFGHAENPDSLASITAKAAWLDECGQKSFKRESHDEISGRLGTTDGRILYTSRPYTFNWLKDDVYDRADRVRRGRALPPDAGYEVVEFESIDNPAFSRDDWEQKKATWPRWLFDMKYRGRFTRPAGAIYDCWRGWQGPDEHDVIGHVVPAFTPDPSWPRYVGTDFGSPNYAAIFLAESPDKKLYVYREYVPEESKSMKEHIAEMRKGELGLPRAAVGGAKSEGQWRIQAAEDGYPIHQPDQPDVEVGINRVYAAIKSDQLFVAANCVKLIDDLNTYSREIDDAGNVLNDIEDKETYHRADALRYIVSWLRRAGVDLLLKVI